MKIFAKIALILIIAGSWAAQPGLAYTAYQQHCLCCKKNICICEITCNGLSEQSLNNLGHNIGMGHCSFKQCNDCTPRQNTEETLLINETSSPKLKKKPVLFVSQTILPPNEYILNANIAFSIYDQHLLSAESLFLRKECLRL